MTANSSSSGCRAETLATESLVGALSATEASLQHIARSTLATPRRDPCPALVVMLCYARSGGTVLNKCLGVLPNVFVASEVHPDVELVADVGHPLERLTIRWQ